MHRHSLDSASVTSILISAGIFATTIQAQDFKDVVGDRIIGRKTLPIVAPDTSRPVLMISILLWSVVISKLWGLDNLASFAFIQLALAVGMRYVFLKSVKSDERSYYLYNVGECLSRAL